MPPFWDNLGTLESQNTIIRIFSILHLNRPETANTHRGLQPDHRTRTLGSGCGLFSSWAKQASNNPIRRCLYSEQYGYDMHHVLQFPPDDDLYKGCCTINYKLTNASYSWRLRSNASHSSSRWIPGKRWQKSIRWSRHAWRFHALLCECIKKLNFILHECMVEAQSSLTRQQTERHTWKRC